MNEKRPRARARCSHDDVHVIKVHCEHSLREFVYFETVVVVLSVLGKLDEKMTCVDTLT